MIAADRIYSWLKQAPDGQMAYLGPASTLRYLNPTGNGSWANLGERDGQYRSYGSYAIYNLGRVLITGGGTRNPSSVLVNLNNNSVQGTNAMNRQRIQHNLTVLADGKVLATGGMQNTDQGLVDVNNGVFEAEVWNPANGNWTVLSSMQVTRQYHSIALLKMPKFSHHLTYLSKTVRDSSPQDRELAAPPATWIMVRHLILRQPRPRMLQRCRWCDLGASPIQQIWISSMYRCDSHAATAPSAPPHPAMPTPHRQDITCCLFTIIRGCHRWRRS